MLSCAFEASQLPRQPAGDRSQRARSIDGNANFESAWRAWSYCTSSGCLTQGIAQDTIAKWFTRIHLRDKMELLSKSQGTGDLGDQESDRRDERSTAS